jgi:hypothetical protein
LKNKRSEALEKEGEKVRKLEEKKQEIGDLRSVFEIQRSAIGHLTSDF